LTSETTEVDKYSCDTVKNGGSALEQSLATSTVTPVNAAPDPLKEKIARLQEQRRERDIKGSIILGRWLRKRGFALNASLEARAADAFRSSLKKPRDRLLCGLPVQSGRSLRSDRLGQELQQVRGERERLQRREYELAKAIREAQRKEDDGRLFLHGEVVRRWREKDPDFAKQLAEDLPDYLKHADDFMAVGMPMPAGWQPSLRESEAEDDSEKVEGTPSEEAGLRAAPPGHGERPGGAESAPRGTQESKAPPKPALKPEAMAAKASDSAPAKPGPTPHPDGNAAKPAAPEAGGAKPAAKVGGLPVPAPVFTRAPAGDSGSRPQVTAKPAPISTTDGG
jgi:hypothetical protein